MPGHPRVWHTAALRSPSSLVPQRHGLLRSLGDVHPPSRHASSLPPFATRNQFNTTESAGPWILYSEDHTSRCRARSPGPARVRNVTAHTSRLLPAVGPLRSRPSSLLWVSVSS